MKNVAIHLLFVLRLLLVTWTIISINSIQADPKITRRSFEPEMIKIRGGVFNMGSPVNEKGRYDNERLHEVLIDDFWIGKTEVTIAQYKVFIEKTGHRKPFVDYEHGNRPVTDIDWFDAIAYTEWLSQETGKSYRLPTEAEWEYAARAGSNTRYSWGDALGLNLANCGECGSQWGRKGMAPVASFRPNDYGLYDMHGNVFEWVCSSYDENYDGGEQLCNFSQEGVDRRVLRGGSWLQSGRFARSAFRYRHAPVNRLPLIGFRIVLN